MWHPGMAVLLSATRLRENHMTDVVSITREGAIGLVALNNPPVNAAGAALRAGLVAALNTLEADSTVKVIAIYGEGRSFIAGADIREFGKPPVDPWLPEVCNHLESCTKPVISVLHGAALGGGLEVAIASHARVAIPGVTLGFPEVTLGILPGAGGTQRGPRLTGIAAALDLITTGRRIGAEEGLALGLVDRISPGAARDVALDAANDVLAGRLQTRRTCDIDVVADPQAIEDTIRNLNTKQPHLFSPQKAAEAVAFATRPIAVGLAEERRLFQACMESPQRAGLIHAFFAERATTKIPEAGVTPRAISKIGVVGAGTMGSGIATACLIAGYRVVLVEQNPEAMARGSAAIAANLDGAVKRGKLSPEVRAALDLDMAQDIGALSGCDLVVEAVFEDMDVKKTVLDQIEAACPGAIIATNTSYLDVNELAQVLGFPEDFIGLHFFSPAHVMRLLEVVPTAETRADVLATVFAFAKRLNKVPVLSGICDGFIGNRIMSAYRKASDFMLLDGAPADQIDRAIKGFGFAMGPFEMSDLAGLDIGWASRKRLAPARDPAARYHGLIADRLCETGQFGRKTGRGFYDHSGKKPVVNPDLAAIIAGVQQAEGITPRSFTDDEIVARYMAAMVMEAADVLADGIAARPIDIDAVFLFGYGFPRWRGGPMHHADQVGAATIVAHLSEFAGEDPHFWHIPPMLDDMARSGGTFDDLNAR